MAQLCSCHEENALALVLDEAVNDRGLAMTSSFSNMVLAGQCVAQLDDLAGFGYGVCAGVAQCCLANFAFAARCGAFQRGKNGRGVSL